ncbi:MAG: hypothetical protein WDA00_01785 [Eubacteriales bacterium]
MKEHEIHVNASTSRTEQKERNCFKDYICACSEDDAKQILREKLKEEGYRNIKLDAIEA